MKNGTSDGASKISSEAAQPLPGLRVLGVEKIIAGHIREAAFGYGLEGSQNRRHLGVAEGRGNAGQKIPRTVRHGF